MTNRSRLGLSLVAAVLFVYIPVNSHYLCDTKHPVEVRSSTGKVIIRNGVCGTTVNQNDLREEPEVILTHLNPHGTERFTVIFMRKNPQRIDYTVHWMLINVLPMFNSTLNMIHHYTLKAYTPPIDSTAAYTILVFRQTALLKEGYLTEDQIYNFNPNWWERLFHPQAVQLFSNVTFTVQSVIGTGPSVAYHPQTSPFPVQPQYPLNPNPPPQYPPLSNPNPIHNPNDHSLPQQYPPYNPVKPTNPPPYNPNIPIIHNSFSYTHNSPSNVSQYQNQMNNTHYNATNHHYQNGTKQYTTQKLHNKNTGVNIIPNFVTLTLSSLVSILYILLNF